MREPLGPVPEREEAATLAERASASPEGARVASPVRERDPTPPPRSYPGAEALPLHELQRWFLDVVTQRGAMEDAPAAARIPPEAVLTHGPVLSATARLGIYHSAYRARLLECLADDYPAVRYALGEEPFERLCLAVIDRTPSRGPNLNHYGRVLRDHLEGGGPGEDGHVEGRRNRSKWAFCRDLSRLEWALVEALHAETPPALDLEALQAVPGDRWSGAVFRRSRALQVLGFEHPVNGFLAAWRAGGQPRIPGKKASFTAVYRQGYTVWRMELGAMAHALLGRLLAGVPLGEALSVVEGEAGEGQVMAWFQAWVAGGFFEEVRV